MSKARILAVDDQRYFRDLIERLLQDDGYFVQTAASGEEALHMLDRDDFEIVVTDLVMPGIDGCELVRRVRERLPEQEIIVVSGVVDVATAVAAMQRGASDYLLKPFDQPALSNSIERILDRRRLRDEHARLIEENHEFMGVLSLFERGAGLFTSLAVEPVAERLVEGLSIETHAQSAVVWVAKQIGSETLELAGARGLIRIEEEAQSISWPELVLSVGSALARDRSMLLSEGPSEENDEALYLPLRFGSDLIGVVRLADKLDEEAFSPADRTRAEKLCEFGSTALCNALRFRGLERRSLRDPETHAYTYDFFEDAVRNEIHKANRFGHRFSLLRVQLECPPNLLANADCSLEALNQGLESRAQVVESALRATDLLASNGPHDYSILLPQTDVLGAGILAQRIRAAISKQADSGQVVVARVAAASFPADGTQLEVLGNVSEERLDQTRDSLLAERPECAVPQPLDGLFDRLLELGSVESVDVEGQILRFVMEDIARRPTDRGLLFVSPGQRWLADALEILLDLRGGTGETEIVMIGAAENQDSPPGVTWSTKSSLDAMRPFVVYFGDAPAYAMVGHSAVAEDQIPIFQTDDRALVEHLAFELLRELEVVISV